MKSKNWVVDDYLDQLLPKTKKLSKAFQKNASCLIKDEDVTYEMLKESYINMAHIVKAYGDHYLPIFERLHQEIQIRKKKDKMLNLAISLSNKNNTAH